MTMFAEKLSSDARRAVLACAGSPITSNEWETLWHSLSSATVCLPHAPCSPLPAAGLLQHWNDLRPGARAGLQRVLVELCRHAPQPPAGQQAPPGEPAAGAPAEPDAAHAAADPAQRLEPPAPPEPQPAAPRRGRRDWFDALVEWVARLLG
jgi:hypothetical protein